jgi:hypothetical protein
VAIVKAPLNTHDKNTTRPPAILYRSRFEIGTTFWYETKVKPFFFAISAIVLLAISSTQAGSEVSPFDPSVSKGKDSILVRGKGFDITGRDVDQVLSTARAANPQDELPSDAEVHVI